MQDLHIIKHFEGKHKIERNLKYYKKKFLFSASKTILLLGKEKKLKILQNVTTPKKIYYMGSQLYSKSDN